MSGVVRWGFDYRGTPGQQVGGPWVRYADHAETVKQLSLAYQHERARAEAAESARLAAVRDRDMLRDQCRKLAAKWKAEPPGNYDFDVGHADGCRDCAAELAQLAEVVGNNLNEKRGS